VTSNAHVVCKLEVNFLEGQIYKMKIIKELPIIYGKEYPIIYKRNTNGSINQWQIFVKDNRYYTEEGILNGKITQSKPSIVKGKNIGKVNETSDFEQACKEAESKHKKKIESGYSEDIKTIDTSKKFFAPMLAHKYLEYKDKISFPILVQPKIDGSRMIIQKEGLFTRNGKKYISCPHISELFKPLFDIFPKWKIDGEIYSHEIPFEKIMSLVRKTKPTKEDLEESKKIVQIYIFDGVVDNINLGFDERFKLIKNEIINIIGKSKYIKFVDVIKINSHNEIEKFHDEFVEMGYEGLIIRIPNSIYENKRSKNLLKYKHFIDEEFELIDIVEGTGNRSGMAGNIVLKMKNGKEFSSGIRGGEDYYRYLLQNKNKLIGKMATIRYQNLSDDEQIPRFPVCVDVGREDLK
jgi:DNA ligase-1